MFNHDLPTVLIPQDPPDDLIPVRISDSVQLLWLIPWLCGQIALWLVCDAVIRRWNRWEAL